MIKYCQFTRELDDLKDAFTFKNYDLNAKKYDKLFMKLYAYNYFCNRIEVSDIFNDDYYRHVKSCLYESFLLLADGYSKGCSLVLRSALENYNKFLLNKYIGKVPSDRSYSVNNRELSKFLKMSKNVSFITETEKLIDVRKNYYSLFSKISHSYETDKAKVIQYMTDHDKSKRELVDNTFENFTSILDNLFTDSLILCNDSIISWDSKDLYTLLNFWKDKPKALKLMNKIKSGIYTY